MNQFESILFIDILGTETLVSIVVFVEENPIIAKLFVLHKSHVKIESFTIDFIDF